MAPKWKLAEGKTWRGKLLEDHPNHGKLVRLSPKLQERFGAKTMLIPRPLDLDALVRKIRKGKLITQTQLRERLARDAGADCGCPLTTGIFLKIVAEAAEEDLRAGKVRVAPFWRVVRENGGMNEKFPGGAESQARRLREEGHTITPARGKQPPKVAEFRSALLDLE